MAVSLEAYVIYPQPTTKDREYGDKFEAKLLTVRRQGSNVAIEVEGDQPIGINACRLHLRAETALAIAGAIVSVAEGGLNKIQAEL